MGATILRVMAPGNKVGKDVLEHVHHSSRDEFVELDGMTDAPSERFSSRG